MASLISFSQPEIEIFKSWHWNLHNSTCTITGFKNCVGGSPVDVARFLEWLRGQHPAKFNQWRVTIKAYVDQTSRTYANKLANTLRDMGWDESTILEDAPIKPRPAPINEPKDEGEKSGGSVDYYQLPITNPTTKGRDPYIAECNDIIEALGMTFAEGNVFKALWRSCAERELGKKKSGGDAVYDAEKMIFFSQRVLANRRTDRTTD
jgi:hypothetical protein